MKKFEWGDTVRVSDAAPSEYRPGCLAEVCGIRQVNPNDAGAESRLGLKSGQFIYLIEFPDGDAIEVPETLVEPTDEEPT